MSYTRTNWVSGETPLSAENMNNIEQGIVDLDSSDQVKIIDNISLGVLSVNASGGVSGNIDISSSIPSGYKLAVPIPRNTGSYAFYFYSCVKANDTSVSLTMFRSTGSATSVSPSIAAICVKA